MKVRQLKAKQQVNEKNVELRQDAKMREMLDKIHKEHYEVEKWQQNFKKQQARDNVAESLRLRQQVDEELAENLLKKEG